MRKVWVEVDPNGHPLRIFKSQKAMVIAMPYCEDGVTVQMNRGNAVAAIRRRVLSLSNGKCIACGCVVTWETMHMDEHVDRGKGGDISVANCEARCADCHIGSRGKHGLSRSPRFGVHNE